MKTKYIYFDFFGTLAFLSKEVNWDEVFNMISGPYGAEDRLAIKLNWISVFIKLQRNAEKTHIEFSMDDVTKRLHQIIPQYTQENLFNITKTYMQLWEQSIVFYQDALESIPKLAQKCHLGIISNTHDPKLVPSILYKYGMSKYFKQIILSVSEKYRKPNKSIFQVATGLSHYSQEWCFVGDSFEQDIRGAIAANVLPILISRGEQKNKEQCITINTLNEIDYVLNMGE